MPVIVTVPCSRCQVILSMEQMEQRKIFECSGATEEIIFLNTKAQTTNVASNLKMNKTKYFVLRLYD